MPSQVRQPRAQILIDGNPIPLVECTVSVSRHARSDTFAASTALAATGQGLGYWAGIGPVECIIHACNDEGEGWTTLLTGRLDAVEVRADAREGVKIHFTGRDNSAKLIDGKLTAKNLNKKSSDIVQELAQKYGLDADVDDTGDDAGKVHTQDNAHLVDNDTPWNVIAELAEREGAFLYFKENKLYFKQPGSDSDGGIYPIRFTPPSEDEPALGSVIAIQLQQNVFLNRGIKQTVRSFHTRKQKDICTTKDAQASGYGDPLEFVDHFAGLTDDQVDKIATKRQIERQRHEMQIDVLMPGDVNFDARMMVQLTGTESDWDQSYHTNTCVHQFSVYSGYTMRISAQNKKGGEGGSEDGGAGGGPDPTNAGDSGVPETQGPAQPQAVPLPPTRPQGL